MDDQRTRTVTWTDPALSRRDGKTTSGLDYLQSIVEGKTPQPPIARLTGYTIREASHGRTLFTLEPHESLYNPFASVHGGILATLLDSAMTSAVLTTLPAGKACVTAGINVDYIKTVTDSTGLLKCEGLVVNAGSRLAHARGAIRDKEGQIMAVGTASLMIFKVA